MGYGELDAYGFHTLEALQCMVERRKGGETGIRAVEWLEGKAVWQWRDGQGRWSIPLLAAALARNPSLKPGRLEDNVKQPVAFVLEYLDGTRAVAYMLEGQVNAWSFAAKMKDKAEPASTFFEQGDRQGSRPFPHFDGLVHCMEEMFVTGKPSVADLQEDPLADYIVSGGQLRKLDDALQGSVFIRRSTTTKRATVDSI